MYTYRPIFVYTSRPIFVYTGRPIFVYIGRPIFVYIGRPIFVYTGRHIRCVYRWHCVSIVCSRITHWNCARYKYTSSIYNLLI